MNRFNGEISLDDINYWIQQFDKPEQYYINKLLDNFIYFSVNRVTKTVEALHKKVISSSSLNIDNIWFIPVGYVTKSGSVIAYYYRNVNRLGENKFISSHDINRIINKNNIALVFIDDYIGTGHQAEQVWEYVVKPCIGLFDESKFYYCTLAATENGINYIKHYTGFEVIVEKVIHNNELPFHDESMVFEDVIERKKAEEIVRKYGDVLYPGNPLGYKNSQTLIGFFYSTPNNTLPIFWSTNEKWRPLLPRNESYRDPKNLVGNIAGLSNQVIAPTPQRAFQEISKLEEYDVSSDFITAGINEFQKLPNVLVLIQPMKQLGFTEEVFKKIIKLLEKLKRNVHEKEAVKASFLLVPNEDGLDDIGNFYIKTNGLDINDTSRIMTLVGMVHTYSNAIIISNKGNVLGIMSLFDKEKINAFLPEEYRSILFATKKVGGLGILCNGDDRVSIIFNGERILLYRGASWALSSSNLGPTVSKLSTSFGVNHELLKKIFEVIFKMSYIGKGTLITIGDEDNVKRHSESPAVEFVQKLNLDICTMSTDSIIGIMEQDGATIISAEGKLIQAMTFLRPPSDAPGKVEVNKGSKHSTAVRISAITNALVIAVSVDGRITLYKNGEIVIKIMG